MINKIKNVKKEVLIKNSFLLPILLVVAISINHVTDWYDIGNPIAWAIYLSVAIEIFALASVSAATININRTSVWFLFILVTSIQIIGNIYFSFNDIYETEPKFLSWVQLIKPFFEDWTLTDHRRLLAILQGGLIPLMSLTALHYYIKFGDKLRGNNSHVIEVPIVEEVQSEIKETPAEIISETIEEKQVQSEINKNDDSDDIAVYATHHE